MILKKQPYNKSEQYNIIQNMDEVVLDSWHFYIFWGVPIYKCSIPLGSFHSFVHHLKFLKPMHVGCMTFNLD